MTFNEYQELAKETAVYPQEHTLIYPALGLAGETGEVVEKVKKLLRDNNQLIEVFKKGYGTPEQMEKVTLVQADLKKELGDVLWYIAALARDLDLDMDDIALHNYQKLKDRQQRNVLHGSGDNR